jgi:hypothetical protein
MKKMKIKDYRKDHKTDFVSCLFDDEDFDKLKNFRWHVTSKHVVHTAKRKGKRICLGLAREIMDCPKGLEVDHKNRNILDNRKINLRICSRALNAANKGPFNSLQIKGVIARRKGWQARIIQNGKEINLGIYPSKEEAGKMYNKVAKFIYGEFAWINL